jgi:hypothetical protein
MSGAVRFLLHEVPLRGGCARRRKATIAIGIATPTDEDKAKRCRITQRRIGSWLIRSADSKEGREGP